MEYVVSSPMKCLDALRQLYPESSRRTLKGWLENGRFTVDQKPVFREDTPLEKGQVLRYQKTKPQIQAEEVKILYEDRYLIAIDKPAGLLSVPLDNRVPSRHALGILRRFYKTDQIFPVHRIDRETSGLLLFAKGDESREQLKDLFETHDITREYFAIVEGRIKEKKGTWKSKLLELKTYEVIESEEGKEAITHFSLIRHSPKYSYLKFQLETGRKHQIRVQARAKGHPVLGDRRYGSKESPIRRLCLHALTLGFVHPFTKKKLLLSSPIPDTFKKLL